MSEGRERLSDEDLAVDEREIMEVAPATRTTSGDRAHHLARGDEMSEPNVKRYRRQARVCWTVKPARLGRIVRDDGGEDVVVKWDDIGFAQHLERRFVAPASSK